MSYKSYVSRLLPPSLRSIPTDLLIVILSVFGTGLCVFIPGIRTTPLRVITGIPFVLFVPGYILIAALFPVAVDSDYPASSAPDPGQATGTLPANIDGIERITLSIATSIPLVIILGLLLELSRLDINTTTLFFTLSAFCIVGTVIATKRRHAVPEADRFTVPVGHWLHTVRTRFLHPPTTVDAAFNLLILLGVVLATVTVGFGVGGSSSEVAFTELYLLTEENDGDLAAERYPTEFVQGESETIIVGLENHERETVQYTIVVELQEVSEADQMDVVREQNLEQFSVTLSHNQSETFTHRVSPQTTGTRLRLAYLLFRGEPPANPTLANAYRETHLWINVTSDESA